MNMASSYLMERWAIHGETITIFFLVCAVGYSFWFIHGRKWYKEFLDQDVTLRSVIIQLVFMITALILRVSTMLFFCCAPVLLLYEKPVFSFWVLASLLSISDAAVLVWWRSSFMPPSVTATTTADSRSKKIRDFKINKDSPWFLRTKKQVISAFLVHTGMTFICCYAAVVYQSLWNSVLALFLMSFVLPALLGATFFAVGMLAKLYVRFRFSRGLRSCVRIVDTRTGQYISTGPRGTLKRMLHKLRFKFSAAYRMSYSKASQQRRRDDAEEWLQTHPLGQMLLQKLASAKPDSSSKKTDT